MVARRPLFSVHASDCDWQAFTVGGHGGSGKDTSNTGVRVTHRASGAVAVARESRSQFQNKRTAFRRMALTTAFRAWARAEKARLEGQPSVDEQFARALAPEHLRVEVRTEQGDWVEFHD